MASDAKRNLTHACRGVAGTLVYVGLSAVLLAGCGRSGDPTPTLSLPDISEPEHVLQMDPTPVVLSLVYQDDFADQASGWDDAFDEYTLKQYGAHKYHIEVNTPNLFAWGLANRDIADSVLEVTTKQWEGPNNNSYGVIFRLQDKDNFYRFDITGDGFFLLSKSVDGKWLTLVDWTSTPAINTGQAENDLRVSALGAKISIYANGRFLAEVEDESFRHGDIGFFAGTFDEPNVHISFDDLRVWAPPASEMVLKASPTSTVLAPPQPTVTFAAIALGQPTATFTIEPSEMAPTVTGTATAPAVTATVTAPTVTGTVTAPAVTGTKTSPTVTGAEASPTVTGTETAPAVTATVTQTAPSVQSTLVPELLPGYVSAVQPKPKDATSVTGRIAYPVFDPDRGTYDIYIVDAATGTLDLVQEDASQPSLSPDGEQLAFRSWDKTTRGLVHGRLGRSDIEMIVKQDEAAHPIWGPSGAGFYFHSRVEADRSPRLYRVEGGPAEVLQYAGDAIRGESPSLLGDDSLVYKGCQGNDCGVMRVSTSGGAPQQLTDDLSDTAPSASPDGEQVAFMTQRSGNWDVYVVNSDGSGLKSLTPDASNEGLPVWSPDGRSIAFLSDRNGTWGLWVMDSDGSNQYQLVQLDGSPDGQVEMAQRFISVGWTEEQISWAP
jgi:hypothetical protein